MKMETKTRAELLKIYVEVGIFSEGLAWACDKKNKWFHIRTNGTPAYRKRYEDVGVFSGGLAWAVKNGKQFNIRADGTPAD